MSTKFLEIYFPETTRQFNKNNEMLLSSQTQL